MRLTLRTLLAWLDDTLPPAEVREIGKQVNDSQVARELVDRINKVTRQRRLTVPHSTGPDATDPNLVAEYLDNVLPHESITAYEKNCLRSDVHLAEVASIHQILSLLGQKAKVPPEARHRMYHLIKGREVARSSDPRSFRPPPNEPMSSAPPWATPEPTPRSNLERFGPPVAVVMLILLISWTTWYSLRPDEPPPLQDEMIALNQPPNNAAAPPQPANNALNAAPHIPPPPPPGAGVAAVAPAPAPKNAGAGAEAQPAEAAKVDVMPVKPEDQAEAKAGNASLLPANAVGEVAANPGLLLRTSGPDSGWEQVEARERLKAGDTIASLDPFRSTLTLERGTLSLVRRSSVKLLPAERSQAGRFELLSGKVVLTGSDPARPYAVVLGESVLLVTPRPDARVGVERINRLVSGETEAAEPVLVVFAGPSSVELGGSAGTETLQAGQVIRFSRSGKLDDRQAMPAPSWVSETTIPPLEREVGKQFLRFFNKDNPPMTSLAEATLADQPEIRRYAVEALGELGQTSLVVGALSSVGDPLVRKAAADVLREQLARGGRAAEQLHQELVRFGGSEEWAALVETLLAGYSIAQARDPMVQKELVNLLDHPDVGVRELALRNLLAISNRGDALGYNPDEPEGDGLKAWQDLLERNELRQAPSEPARQ